MAAFVGEIIQNSLSGFVSGAVGTVGGYAGDAICGVGDLIEAKGQQVGDGITQRVDGLGRSISGYGASARNATAPNLSKTQYPVKKQITSGKVARSKSTSAVPTVKKALPAPERKLLEAPPPKAKPKPKKEVQNGIGTYDKAVAPFKGPSKAPATFVPSVSTLAPRQSKPKAPSVAQSTRKTPVSAAKKASSPAPFSKTTPGGKVVVSKQSRPGYKAPAPGKTEPKPLTTQSRGYGGPLQLGGLASAGGKSRAAPSVAGSVARPPGKPSGGYGGPLELGGLASKAGGSRVAPSVAGR